MLRADRVKQDSYQSRKGRKCTSLLTFRHLQPPRRCCRHMISVDDICAAIKSTGTFDAWRDRVQAHLEEDNKYQSLTDATTAVVQETEGRPGASDSVLEETLTRAVLESTVPALIESCIKRAFGKLALQETVQAAVRQHLKGPGAAEGDAQVKAEPAASPRPGPAPRAAAPTATAPVAPAPAAAQPLPKTAGFRAFYRQNLSQIFGDDEMTDAEGTEESPAKRQKTTASAAAEQESGSDSDSGSSSDSESSDTSSSSSRDD